MKPLLLIVGTGEQQFSQYPLDSITQQYKVHVFVDAKPSWGLEYLDGYTCVDTHDAQAMISAAKDLQASAHVAGVLCWDEAGILTATQMAAALGLPGDPAAVVRCADKQLSSQALSGLLLEEPLTGYRISVETAVHGGEMFPLCLARSVESGHYVHADDPLLHDPELIRLLHDAHRALGFADSMTHTEIMMTDEGPKIIEVNAWLGGDLVPYLGWQATGVDIALVAAAVACGRLPPVSASLKRVAAIRFVDGGAFVTAAADTREECEAALDLAEAALRV